MQGEGDGVMEAHTQALEQSAEHDHWDGTAVRLLAFKGTLPPPHTHTRPHACAHKHTQILLYEHTLTHGHMHTHLDTHTHTLSTCTVNI